MHRNCSGVLRMHKAILMCAMKRVRLRVMPSVLVDNRSNLQQCIEAAMNACIQFIHACMSTDAQ